MRLPNTQRRYLDLSALHPNEVWGHYCDYFISTNGILYSARRKTLRKVNPGLDKDGYRRAYLATDTGRVHKHVHTMVLEVFIGPRPKGMVAAHNNCDRIDNRADNLRWTTQKDNLLDKKKHGTWQAGEKHSQATITNKVARQIKTKLEGVKKRGDILAIAHEMGVSKHIVYHIKSGVVWA